MIVVSKYTFSGQRITIKTITYTQIRPLTLMVATFQNGRRNTHVSISQFLIHVEKKILVSKHTFLGPKIT